MREDGMAAAGAAGVDSPWRDVAAGIAVDCLGMGERTVRAGLEANPFELRLMRAGQPFDGADVEPDGEAAESAGLHVRRPFEDAWERLCGTGEDEMAASIAGLLAGYGDGVGPEAVRLASSRRAERLAVARMLPSAGQGVAVRQAGG